MSKATHDGHCQVCGSRQRLPQGVLAKHGYDVRFGFFNGTCYGSAHLPFQKDITLVHEAIGREEEHKARLVALAADYRNPEHSVNSGDTAQWHEYIPATWQTRRSSYQWREITITATPNAGGWTDFTFVTHDGRVANLRQHCIASLVGGANTVRDYVLALNELYAASLDRSIRDINHYLTWQRERIAGWKPTDLLPREGGK